MKTSSLEVRHSVVRRAISMLHSELHETFQTLSHHPRIHRIVNCLGGLKERIQWYFARLVLEVGASQGLTSKVCEAKAGLDLAV